MNGEEFDNFINIVAHLLIFVAVVVVVSLSNGSAVVIAAPTTFIVRHLLRTQISN